MKYKILLPLLLTGFIFNACSKDEAETETTGDKILSTYYPGTTLEIKELSIHTKNGNITDQATIQSFIERNVSQEMRVHFFVGMSSVPIPQSTQILHFLDNNRVNVNGVNMQIASYKDSVMLVSEYTSTPFPSYSTTCGTILGHVPAYTAFTDCPDGTCGSYRKTAPLITSGANYYAPLLTYAVVTKDCAITATEVPVINVINPELNSMLNEGDSVLIQYAKLPLIKEVN